MDQPNPDRYRDMPYVRLGASVLQDQHVDYSWELLTRAPGVQVTQFKQGTDAGRFSMRGFNGEGRVLT